MHQPRHLKRPLITFLSGFCISQLESSLFRSFPSVSFASPVTAQIKRPQHPQCNAHWFSKIKKVGVFVWKMV